MTDVACKNCGAAMDVHEQPIGTNVPEDFEMWTKRATEQKFARRSGDYWVVPISGCSACKKDTLIENARMFLKDDAFEEALTELGDALGIRVGGAR